MTQPADTAQGNTPVYTKSMMDYLGDREPLAVFEETPAVLRARCRSDATTISGSNPASTGTANLAWFKPVSVSAESR